MKQEARRRTNWKGTITKWERQTEREGGVKEEGSVEEG